MDRCDTGNSYTLNNHTVDWSIGEPISETFSNGNFILTQGFHQSKIFISSISNNIDNKDDVLVYPNPTESIINIEFKHEINFNVQIKLIDISGKVILNDKMTTPIYQINIENFADGLYLLVIGDENSVKRIKSILINKI